MALKQNGFLAGSPIRLSGGGVFASGRGRRAGDGSLHAAFVGGFQQDTGIPSGYRPPGVYILAVKEGGISSFTTAGGSTASMDIASWEVATPTAAGVATTSITGFLTESRTATAAGVASSTSSAITFERMSAALSIGATPSAVDIAQAVLGGVEIDEGLNLRQVMRLLAAINLGKSSGFTTGASSPVFKGLDGSTTRISATTDANGNRTAVTLTAGD